MILQYLSVRRETVRENEKQARVRQVMEDTEKCKEGGQADQLPKTGSWVIVKRPVRGSLEGRWQGPVYCMCY